MVQALELPGSKMFQESRIDHAYIRRAILHSYGLAKHAAPGAPSCFGWETLRVCLHGLKGDGICICAAHHVPKWTPAPGMLWHGTVRTRAALLLRWSMKTPVSHPNGRLSLFEPSLYDGRKGFCSAHRAQAAVTQAKLQTAKPSQDPEGMVLPFDPSPQTDVPTKSGL